MNEEFIKRIYDAIVNDNIKIYKNQFKTYTQLEIVDDYTKNM